MSTEKNLAPLAAATNEGRVVQLYKNPGLVPESISVAREHPAFAGRLIATGPGDPSYNCHGWAFTAGEFAVDGSSVDLILRDNRYTAVDKPQAGDLAIWRDELGLPAHTGIVRATGNEFVLIESKWGVSGRYLHAPEDQGYSQDLTYYRSPRVGHLLRIPGNLGESQGFDSESGTAHSIEGEPADSLFGPDEIGAE